MAETMQTDSFPVLPSGLAEVDKMIRERGDLFSDTQCKVCSAVLISQSQKLTHYQSKKHANKVRRFLSLENENGDPVKKPKTSDDDCNNGDTDRLKACHLCNMTFTSPVMAESHYQGKFHAKRLKMKAVESQTPEASQISQPAEKPADNPAGGSETDNNNNPDRFCSTCKASFNNPLMAQQHYAGKKHKKHMTRLKLMETYGPSTAPGQTAARFWFPSFVLCRLTALILVAYYTNEVSSGILTAASETSRLCGDTHTHVLLVAHARMATPKKMATQQRSAWLALVSDRKEGETWRRPGIEPATAATRTEAVLFPCAATPPYF
ncbi:zinc finger protein 346 [Poecilia reticulata]|uniref:zinc finger protein 346 n=1 Tax=Poecilia reticulata TaxID=8081 RepID=UPI0007EB35AA|nr:PREDICTED: zinc finger protein 346 [Poecilia reticulata]